MVFPSWKWSCSRKKTVHWSWRILGQLSQAHPGWHDHNKQWQALMSDGSGEGHCITPLFLGIFPVNCHSTEENKRFLLLHWIFQFRLSILMSEVEPLSLKIIPGAQNTPLFQKRLYVFSFYFFRILHVGISQTTLMLPGITLVAGKMLPAMRTGLNQISSE